ncbi:MAG: RNA-binding domain-containing protein [Candidatus Methanomethylicaceae archaeon]|jgi:RNA binding exosome subunit
MITAISFSTIAHSTEDISKVETAILNLLPDSMRRSQTVSAQEVVGHHGNPIWLVALGVREKASAGEISEYIMRLIPVADRLRIRDQLDLFYDGRSTLFLRLDKQNAFLREARLSSGDDVIRVKISFIGKRGDRGEVLKVFGLY